ncbi:FtsX-like permease family protein [Roseomonas sp. BU-1]|uniref:FtsX-like permease family protein n=2 Tax=Falsiroseomonas selenitidurans TaxID=2716335 RepID=A0ABX1EB27_9PROT|nr:FtsX-like permease family protein [Falsiroseomonas selenitidurans]
MLADLRQGALLARRELRGGFRQLRIVLACLALGVAAIAAVGTLRAATEAGLLADGAKLLGGDVEVRVTYRPLPEAALEWAQARGAATSEVVEMRAMAIAPSGERALVELKAVDAAWPLYGALRLDPPGASLAPEPGAAEAGAPRAGRHRVALEASVVERLGVSPGDEIRLGEARLVFAGTIVEEPDRVASPAVLGPRALVLAEALPATALIQPGSLVSYDTRLRLPPGTDVRRFAREFRAAQGDGGWRVRTADQAEPGVNRFLDRAAAFLVLAGFTALLVGGIGVATGVRAWLEARGRTIATLRCLGAPAGVILSTYLIQVLVLAVAGIVIGLVAGFGLTWLAAQALAGALPVPPRLGVYPAPLALAALYGLLTALAFSLWPLGRAQRIPGAALFRDLITANPGWPSRPIMLATGLAGLALVGLVVGTAEQPRFALGFCAGAALTLLLFRLGASGLMAFARSLRGIRRPSLRLGLANLYRPGAPTPTMLVALGIGLTTLAAIATIEGNLRRQLSDQMPAAAPSFFFIDIQSDQADRFTELATSLPSVSEVRSVPSLRARIVTVDGVPADQVQATEETRWALRGDRGLTYAATPPEGTRLAAGQWWPADYQGPPLVSFDANLAAGWGVRIGSVITVNVLGRDLDLRVASLREIPWRGLGINYTLVASPGLLSAAPHTHIATVRAAEAAEPAVLRRLTDAFPNISGIRVRDALEAVAGLLARIGVALQATSSVTLLAGMLVLAGAVAAGQRARVRDAVVLKTIGATRGQIRRAWLVEFGLLGLVAGLLAAAAGSAASWAVVRFVMRADWVFLPGTLGLTVLGCVLLTLGLGYVGTALALRVRPAPLLRNE